MKDYLSARLSERTTSAGLISFALGIACLFFPEQAGTITTIAGLLGLGVAVVPTGGKPK